MSKIHQRPSIDTEALGFGNSGIIVLSRPGATIRYGIRKSPQTVENARREIRERRLSHVLGRNRFSSDEISISGESGIISPEVGENLK